MAKTPDQVKQYVSIKGVQTKSNDETLVYSELAYDLKPCGMLNPMEQSNLTLSIEKTILKKKPYCIDKYYNYTM